MGSGTWSAATYSATTLRGVAAGTTFGYTKSTSRASRSTWAAHEDLDPKKLAGPTSPFAGKNIRESRDNPDHPLSKPVATFFDCTGSMGSVPREVQKKLGEVFGLLLRKGYIQDPQIMIGAYGDAYCDQVPLQASEFESDNRIDDALDKLFLEGGGGGNNGETMSLAWYFLANHTASDAWDKRGEKGYAFFIADEVALPLLQSHVEKFILPSNGEGGVLGEVEGDLSVKSLADAMLERWEAYVLVVDNDTAHYQGSLKFYRDLFGERALRLTDPDSIAETIALTIGMLEGAIGLDDGLDDLHAAGASDSVIESAGRALATLGTTAGAGGGVVVADAPADLDSGAATRL